MSISARRTPIFFAAIALLLALATSANAAQRSFSAQRISGASADFRVSGLNTGSIGRAQLKAAGYRTLVPAGQVGRAAKRGTLRLRLPRAVAKRLQNKPGRGHGWPTLIINTPSSDSTAPAPTTSEPTPVSTPVHTHAPATPDAPTTPTAPAAPTTPTAPATPDAPDTSGIPSVPVVPEAPVAAGTRVAESTSGFETGNFSEFTSLQNKFGSLSVTSDRAYQGTKSARATWAGGPQGAQRVWQNTDWHNGTDVWYGMAVYVPADTEYCYWNPIRWDNYDLYGGVDDNTPGEGDVGGLTVEQGRIYIMKNFYGGEEHKLVDGGTLAKGRWTWLELHQKFSNVDGQALSELYVDGQKRGSSTKANSAGRRITDLRAGVVNVASSCSTPNAIDFDRVTISNSQRGPLS